MWSYWRLVTTGWQLVPSVTLIPEGSVVEGHCELHADGASNLKHFY
jgi:hypothetical protein